MERPARAPPARAPPLPHCTISPGQTLLGQFMRKYRTAADLDRESATGRPTLTRRRRGGGRTPRTDMEVKWVSREGRDWMGGEAVRGRGGGERGA
jgi:hypothetical protein